MELDPSVYLSCFKVQVYESPDAESLRRDPPTYDDSRLIESLILNVSREIVKPHDYHLLAPFFSLITPATYQPSQFTTPRERRTRYCQANIKALDKLAGELRQRLARSPLTALIVDTKKPRWTASSPVPGCESTIIVERRFIDVLKLGGPESRLFGFLVVYHEFAHMIRRWYLCHGIKTELAPKKMVAPGFFPRRDDRNKGEAGEFVEWACFGGVAEWSKGGLFIQVREGLACRVLAEGAQKWWNSTTYPHILDFLTARAQSGCKGEYIVVDNDSFVHPISPSTYTTPLVSHLGLPFSTRTAPTQLTTLNSYESSLLSGLNNNISSKSPKTPKTQTEPNNLPAGPTDKEGGVTIAPGTYTERLHENLLTMQKAYGEEDYEWLARVIGKSAIEDQHFQFRHFDFKRMDCVEDSCIPNYY